VGYAQKKECSLRAATMEVRESQHARVFRTWCARFSELTGGGRVTLGERMEMFRELRDVCDVWTRDVREEVDYRRRKLNLEAIPLIGGLLKAVNMHESLVIKDPILRPRKPYAYLLFLNDLLRPPQ
jgi:hypothetical protein